MPLGIYADQIRRDNPLDYHVLQVLNKPIPMRYAQYTSILQTIMRYKHAAITIVYL